jgi:hypothetical protein
LGGEKRVTAILREVNVIRLEKPTPEGAICFDHLRPEVAEVNPGITLELHGAERGVGLLDILVEGVPRTMGGENGRDDEFGVGKFSP